MKDINEIYKDWCGESHTTNSCNPVHDSAQAMDFAQYYSKEILKEITLEEAEDLAMRTDYAVFSCEPEGNEINKADAGAFFLEGYNHAFKSIQNQ